MTPDVNVYISDMPTSVKAFTVVNPDGSYTILLNSRHSHHQHLISYHHEMCHIENGDYDKQCSADLIEFYAHG